MHLLIPLAAPLSEAGREVLRDLALPNLTWLLAHGSSHRHTGDDSSLSPPHEQALAAALAWAGADGQWPVAAWRAGRDGLAPVMQPLALLSPVHLRVGADQIQLLPPAHLSLDDAESQALFDAVEPLVAGDGGALRWGAAQRWYLQHPALPAPPLPALDRVAGRNLLPWRQDWPEPVPLRRLLNEVQMLLHEHPVNQQRDLAGLPSVNALWLSGCGPTPAADDGLVQVDERLVAPAQAEDWPAWAAAWRALDESVLLGLRHAAPGNRLSLCGERGWLALTMETGSAWQRLRRAFERPVSVAAHLEAL